ncbi:MAG: AsmA family protein [Candidatus Acidiferrales bacterium]|jgi:AsmA protein
MNKKPLMIAGGIVLVLLLIVLALPLFINANQFKPTLETQLASALGRQVGIGDISLSIFSGGVTVSDVSIADDPAFSKSPFLTTKSLSVGVELLPLIFSKKLEVRSLSVKDPEVNLIHAANGTWNYSTLGGNAGAAKSPVPGQGGASSAEKLSVGKLSIENGKIIVSAAGSSAKPSIYQNVDLEASDLSYTSQFPFKLTATGPGNAALKLAGKAGPMNSADASLTPLSATLEVQHLDLASTGFLDASSGIGGVVDFKGDLSSDGSQLNSKGTVKATKLKLSAAGEPSSVPLNVDYATTYALKSRSGNLNQGDIHIGNALARLNGAYNTASETAKLDMRLNAQAMPVTDLQGFLPAVGVVVPPGSKLQGGSLTANLTVSGPVDKLVVSGPINLSNAKLAGFSLKSKLGALGSFSGLGGSGGGGSDTDIQTLSATVRNDPSGTKIDSLNLVMPSLGTVTGNGTVSAAGQLNFKLVANLSGAAGALTGAVGGAGAGGAVGGGKLGMVTALAGGGRGGSGSSNGIPFIVQGTTSNPQVIPDAKAIAVNAAKNRVPGGSGTTGAAAGALGGLFGKKKTPQ